MDQVISKIVILPKLQCVLRGHYVFDVRQT